MATRGTERPQAQAMTAGEMERRAIQRALANGGAAAVTRLELGVYRVKSATRRGVTHRVVVTTDGHWWCSCEAGVSGKPVCWHRASVYIAKLEHASKGRARVTGAASVAPETPANMVDIRSKRAA